MAYRKRDDLLTSYYYRAMAWCGHVTHAVRGDKVTCHGMASCLNEMKCHEEVKNRRIYFTLPVAAASAFNFIMLIIRPKCKCALQRSTPHSECAALKRWWWRITWDRTCLFDAEKYYIFICLHIKHASATYEAAYGAGFVLPITACHAWYLFKLFSLNLLLL